LPVPVNPNNEQDYQRALFTALKDWVITGTRLRPASIDGRRRNARRLHQSGDGVPDGPEPSVQGRLREHDARLRLGPAFIYNDMSGVIGNEPPPIVQKIPTLVPKVNADGNEIGGLQTADGPAPDWHVPRLEHRHERVQQGRICAFTGASCRSPRTKAERLANGDPRLSIEERYPSLAAFSAAATAVIDHLVAQRYLLPGDGARELSKALSDLTNNDILQ